MTAQQPPRQAQGIALQVQQLDRQFGPLRVLNHLDLYFMSFDADHYIFDRSGTHYR